MTSPLSPPSAPLLGKLSLWPHQLEALAGLRDYVREFRAKRTVGSALVHMPTGSGKTAIIATLARCLPEIDCVLVVAPREALRDQLALDIHHRFFDNLSRAPRTLPKRVLKIPGNNLAVQVARGGGGSRLSLRDVAREDPGRTVFVMTDQMLDTLRRAGTDTAAAKERHRFFALLERSVTLLLVDEGHYEPALSWGQAIRHFSVPRILFTATPFRNDLKAFDTDYGCSYSYAFERATADKFIRPVEIKERRSGLSPNAFVDDVLEFYDGTLIPQNPRARVIIRCESAAKIRQMSRVLQDRRRSFVAIHETFPATVWPIKERRSVPSRDDEPEWYGDGGPVFWIHQFKLLEGIDDPRFQLLALYDPLTNVRAFVQQVGRVLRNPDYPEVRTAVVLDHSGGAHRRAWLNFLSFDRSIAERGGPLQPLGKYVFEHLRDALPDPAYVDGSFRDRFDFKSCDPKKQLAVPFAVNLLTRSEKFSLGGFARGFEQRLREEDRFFERYQIDASTVVYLHFSVSNTPFLNESYFLNCTLDLAVIHEAKHYLAFYDSSGFLPLRLDKQGVGAPISGTRLRRLFRAGEGARLVEVALKNSQLGHRAVRTRSFTAASVESTVPALDDPAQVLTRVTGYSIEAIPNSAAGPSAPPLVPALVRRYIGLRHGRVSDSGSRVPLEDYLRWVRQLVAYAEDSAPPIATFARYAPEAIDVTDPTPANVLLDVFDVQDDFVTIGDEDLKIAPDQAMRLEELCQSVSPMDDDVPGTRFGFSVEGNGHPARVLISYDKDARRYVLESADLDKRYRRARGAGRDLVAYLNQEQSFRVVPAGANVIYADGAFYQPVLELGSRFNPDQYHVGKILEPFEILRKTGSEKGESCVGDDWDSDSLFGLISRLGDGTRDLEKAFDNPDLLICDDLGTEVADFILADPPGRVGRRVVFVHAKGAKYIEKTSQYRFRPYSAGALTEVCGQAIKNIRYLSMFNALEPPNLGAWGGVWSTSGVVGTATRIRRAPLGHEEPRMLWEVLRQRISDPTTYREVWLFLGMTLSKARLEKELRRIRPTPEAVQALVLLHGTMAAVGSIDAKLRIFCSP